MIQQGDTVQKKGLEPGDPLRVLEVREDVVRVCTEADFAKDPFFERWPTRWIEKSELRKVAAHG